MSDLCMYELEDNVWDEFGESGDHIVPSPIDKDGDKCAVQGDSRKKARHEVNGLTDNTTRYFIHGKDEKLTKKDTMLEKGSWSQTPDGVFPSSSDGGSFKEVTGITTDDSKMSGQCLEGDNIGSVGSELCANDPILADSNSNSYDYPLGHVSQTDNELSFYDNDGEGKESSDLLYYGWPDIGNFEDVDRMFRSCDTTFGLGSLSNDDGLCWLSSSPATEGPEEALKPAFKFLSPDSSELKNVTEQNDPSMSNNTGPSIDDPDRKSLSSCDKIASQAADADDLAPCGRLQFIDEVDAKPENCSQPVCKEQISSQRKQSKHHGHPGGKRKDCYSEHNGSFQHSSNLMQFDNVKHSCGDSSKSNQVFSSPDVQHVGSAPLTYMQTHAPYVHLDFRNPSDQNSVPTLSGTNSENNSYPSPSPKESSLASNQVQYVKSSSGPLFEPAAVINEKRKKVHGCQEVQGSLTGHIKHGDTANPTSFCHRVLVEKQSHQSGNEMEGLSEVKGGIIPAELDSSNVQESTCMSSVMDEVSLQATSFRQLQQITEKLDIRTKLCIRDSLYRLARSAAQRHNFVNPSGGISNDRDANGALVADESNKSTGFMDIETNTNPIDRSIAHLLFHRPSDPSARPANDVPSLKSHAMVHGSLLSPPMISENQILPEPAAGTNNKLPRDGEK